MSGAVPSPSHPAGTSPHPEGNRPPVIKAVRLLPDPVMPKEPIKAEVDADDPDGDSLMFRLQWFANGQPIAGETKPVLPPHTVKRGDQIAVEVVPMDGTVEGVPVRSQTVAIPNTPPEIVNLTLEPGQPHVGDTIKVDAQGKDQDNDSVGFRFRWLRNGTQVSDGETSQLATAGYARGDVIMVEVTPFDSIDKGQPFRSPAIVVVNNDPRITSTPPDRTVQGRYEYVVAASDPEGDPVTFDLEAAPPGMTVDKRTGRIEWQVPPALQGSHRVRVVVRDDHGGSGFQEFEVGMATPRS